MALQKQRSKKWLINEVLKEYIEKQRIESKRWSDTLLALHSLKEGKEIQANEIELWLQSWGTENELTPIE